MVDCTYILWQSNWNCMHACWLSAGEQVELSNRLHVWAVHVACNYFRSGVIKSQLAGIRYWKWSALDGPDYYHPVNDRRLTCNALGIFLTVNHLITKPTLIYFQCNQKSLLPLYLINVATTSLWNLATMPILIYWYYKWNCLKIMNERESYITLVSFPG